MKRCCSLYQEVAPFCFIVFYCFFFFINYLKCINTSQLFAGDSYCITSQSCKYECQDSVNLSSSSACRADSLENIPSTSGSVGGGVTDNGFCTESNISLPNTYPYISDVHSLAWGLCGDTYKQNKEAPFKEFLIVVGNSGVTFHAFRQADETDAIAGQSFKSEHKLGRWVEWGSSSVSPHDNKAFGDIPPASRMNGSGGTSYHAGQESGSHLPSASTSKKWLRSFLSSAKSVESDGTIWTRFPEKSEFPCSATVVSFFVDFSDSVLFDFYSGTHSVVDKGAYDEKMDSILVDNEYNAIDHTSPDGLTSDTNVAASRPYTCFKVFSSWFHYLIGFVLSSGFDDSENSCDSSCKSQDIVVLVALLDIDGLQWLYAVKLPVKDVSSEVEWVDFQISDKFFMTLNKFGSILLYGAVTGEYIAYLDILQIHGLKPKHNLAEQNILSIDTNDTPENDRLHNKLDAACILTTQTCGVAHKQCFRRLIVAPYSCLFTVVDECGVLYIVCARDHVPNKYVMTEKILPQYLKLGVLAPWVVGHSDISQQKAVSTSSGSGKSFMRNNFESSGFQHVQQWHVQGINQDDSTLSGLSAESQQSFLNDPDSRFPRCTRKLFIPIAKHGVADIMCFSPSGVTRLIRRNSTKSERNCIVHTSLYIESNFCDDKCLNLVNSTFDLQHDANVVDEEAVGCIFQGCLYLVTRSGVSIVLPAVSLSSNIHTVDSMSYRSTKYSEAAALNLEKSLMYDKSEQPGSGWQVAVIDRIILYEGPDEADRLCSENGKCFLLLS